MLTDSQPNSSRSILIVDDDDDTREAIQEVLEIEGYQVLGLSDGRTALRWLEDSPRPDLIILDLMMPGLNGWQFLEITNAKPQFADLPVLVVTADGRVSRDPTSLPCAGFLAKPIDLESLLSSVAHLLGAR